MCFDIGSRHLGCWGQTTSRIQNKEVYATLCLQAGAIVETAVVRYLRYMLDLRFCYITCAAVVVIVYWPSNPRHEIIYTVHNIIIFGIILYCIQ